MHTSHLRFRTMVCTAEGCRQLLQISPLTLRKLSAQSPQRKLHPQGMFTVLISTWWHCTQGFVSCCSAASSCLSTAVASRRQCPAIAMLVPTTSKVKQAVDQLVIATCLAASASFTTSVGLAILFAAVIMLCLAFAVSILGTPSSVCLCAHEFLKSLPALHGVTSVRSELVGVPRVPGAAGCMNRLSHVALSDPRTPR